MSLLKLRRTEEIDKALPSYKSLEQEFTERLDTYIEDSTVTRLADMILVYANYSYVYLDMMSEILEPDEKVKGKMVIYNSIIVEACNEVGIMYFDKHQGYSIIDKAVAYVVDNGIQYDANFILEVIEEMNKPEDCEPTE